MAALFGNLKKDGDKLVYEKNGLTFIVDVKTKTVSLKASGDNASSSDSFSTTAGYKGTRTIKIPGTNIDASIDSDGKGNFSYSVPIAMGALGLKVDISYDTATDKVVAIDLKVSSKVLSKYLNADIHITPQQFGDGAVNFEAIGSYTALMKFESRKFQVSIEGGDVLNLIRDGLGDLTKRTLHVFGVRSCKATST